MQGAGQCSRGAGDGAKLLGSIFRLRGKEEALLIQSCTQCVSFDETGKREFSNEGHGKRKNSIMHCLQNNLQYKFLLCFFFHKIFYPVLYFKLCFCSC